MSMMEVGVVRVSMDERRMPVPMRMLHLAFGAGGVVVAVVTVMHVPVFVLDLRMRMLVEHAS